MLKQDLHNEVIIAVFNYAITGDGRDECKKLIKNLSDFYQIVLINRTVNKISIDKAFTNFVKKSKKEGYKDVLPELYFSL